MKRFQLWMRRPSRALPVCSSESARISPSAEASGMVRKARRKLLACVGERGGRKIGFWLLMLCECASYIWSTDVKMISLLLISFFKIFIFAFLCFMIE